MPLNERPRFERAHHECTIVALLDIEGLPTRGRPHYRGGGGFCSPLPLLGRLLNCSDWVQGWEADRTGRFRVFRCEQLRDAEARSDQDQTQTSRGE